MPPYVDPAPSEGPQIARLFARTLLGFAVLWTVFYAAYVCFPFVAPGAEVIYRTKLHFEETRDVYPPRGDAQRVLIFGNSRTLAGFMPSEFDRLAEASGARTISFNSGYPARTVFLPQLKAMAERGQAPDVLLLTQPWQDHVTVFRPILNDFEFADQVFPFRHMIRDTLSFVSLSKAHGGVRKFYSESRATSQAMLRDRGYYFIAEQAVFPDNRLPEYYVVNTDTPLQVKVREGDPASRELAELNDLVTRFHMKCYFVPDYARESAFAAARILDEPFADVLQKSSACRMLGPDYFSYPNSMFSDVNHLNPDGAKIYTRQLLELVQAAGASAVR